MKFQTLCCFVFLLYLQSCSWFQLPQSASPWAETETPPQRVFLLTFDSLSPSIFEDASLVTFQKLKKKGIVFEEAWIGHLPAVPSISLNVLLSGLLPRNLPPPPPPSFLSQSPESFRELENCLSFMTQSPNWAFIILRISPSTPQISEKEFKRLVDFLEEKNLLKETLLLVTSLQGRPALPEEYILSEITKLKASPLVRNLAFDSTLRIDLNQRTLANLLSMTNLVQKLRGVTEIYYRAEVSHRSHYIRTFRSPVLAGNQLDWISARHPILTQSLAGSHGPDVLAFFSIEKETELQKIPLGIWTPNLRFNHPSTLQNIIQTRARLVDIAPIVLEVMKRPVPPHLDGSNLGIQSVIN